MNTAEFTDDVRDDNETALSRLGSSKSVYALTEGEMEEAVVLSRAAVLSSAAAQTFDEWADQHDAFATAADVEREHYETIVDRLDERPSEDTPPIYATLGGLDDTAARLGGFIGWSMVLGATMGQLTGYFTGQADPQTSQVFRSMGEDIENLQEIALDALAANGDWERAQEAANAVVQDAYDDYFETLESLGVNPKPVC